MLSAEHIGAKDLVPRQERSRHTPNPVGPDAKGWGVTIARKSCMESRAPMQSQKVRYGSFCDIGAALAEVRFVPYSGRIARRQLTSA